MHYTGEAGARSKRFLLLLIAAGLLVVGCSGTTADPSTTTAATPTTTPPSATPPTTSTTTTTDALLPAPVEPIEGVPEELVALIGAPMPGFNRTIAAATDGLADPGDIQRWLIEWDTWQRWIQANLSSITGETISLGFEPQSEMWEIWTTAAAEDPTPTLLSESLDLTYADDNSSVGTGYSEGTSLTVSTTSALFHSYLVVDGAVVEESGPRTELAVAFILVGTEFDGTTIWRVSSVEY